MFCPLLLKKYYAVMMYSLKEIAEAVDPSLTAIAFSAQDATMSIATEYSVPLVAEGVVPLMV